MVRAGHGEDRSTRERVTRAAVGLFAERGFNGTGIRDIASAAGLTTSTLYHYMTNKDDLLVEVMLGTITPLRDAALKIISEIDDPSVCLATLVEHHVWLHASDTLGTLVSDTELRALPAERRAQMVRLRDEYERSWHVVIHRGVETGVFDTLNPDLTARSLVQMATGVSHWFSAGGELSLTRLCHAYSDLALGLVRASRPGGVPIRRDDLTLPAPTHYLPDRPAT
ncbi:TetR/AcrR family transcriptional regulator [Rhizohabitans arisaemae]|uniref:TetR/AcrR family transcriptional regulator n=1 Tax=Rhizohabitans arisaemae TaxID=2720610 RepID=UPI0024B25958|nr:TetR/AcrR family transcriptional regulator [Rhizohabitans arisaemae]